ncbi:hypothetical protein LX36DRAFT_650580 [Colletotrichum falcatum]|nr:hypothetical protein LX36DRAFT_650580 [Colletotrichum falcatum]
MRLQDSHELSRRPQSFSQDTATEHFEPTSFPNCQDLSIAIHLTMANQNYIGQTSVHPDGLSDHMISRRSSMAQPHTTAYPELDSPSSYSVATFDQQNQINEADMLTPVSGVGSPCFQQSANLSQYPSAMTPMQPQASPSGPSRMLWHNPVNMSAAQSQVGSPMSINPPTSESHFEMGYIPAENDDLPKPPADYYWGSYSVSAPSETEQGSLSPQIPPGYYIPHNSHHVMQPQPMMGQMPSELPMPRHAPPSVHAPYYPQQNHTSWVEQPDITEFKTTASRRRQFGYSLPSTQIARQEPIAQTFGPSRPGRPQPVARVARQARVRGRAIPPSTEATTAADIAEAQLGESIPDLADEWEYKGECPDEHRFLYERQRELTAAGMKNTGMWEVITKEFNQRFGTDFDIPRLQMKVSRGRYIHFKMSPRDQRIVNTAIGLTCQQFWKMVTHKFRELGGGRVIPWRQSGIECYAVDLGLVDGCYVPMPKDLQTKTRKFKKASSRLKSGAYSDAILQEAANNGGGVFEQNPQLYDQVMNEIIDYRGEEAIRKEENGDEDEDKEMPDNIYQTRSKGKGRQGGVDLNGCQGVDDTSGKVTNTRKTARPRRAPAKPRAKGRLAPKTRAS